MRVDLIWLAAGTSLPHWPLGEVTCAAVAPAALAEAASNLPPAADAVLFWDATLGAPDVPAVMGTLCLPGDVWHAGLRLGMGGLPRMIDFVDPVWRFNRDPDAGLVATSWRLSLRACLARTAVLRRLGGPDPSFETVAGASLELGRRWIARGAMLRHVPALLPGGVFDPPALTPGDEFRFVRTCYGRLWAAWACCRALRHGAPIVPIARAWRGSRLSSAPARRSAVVLHASADMPPLRSADILPTVSVLIPTLDRYPHLFKLLDQLRTQTVRPLEIIVVDQSPGAAQAVWPERYADLPLRVIARERAGQCSSRNAGLVAARGTTVLFLDDDDEVPRDLIARHLDFLAGYGLDASCGVAEERGAGSLPAEFGLVRDSDVFPTNNSLLRIEALCDSGLFDLAYERGERADGDLGMRLYLAGGQLGLNPAATVVHLHAPRGGLRQHKARVTTRASSRAGLRRHLLAPTEGYYWSRYFTPGQVQEALLIRTVGTLRGSGGAGHRLLRALVMGALLPDSWRRNRARLAQGRALLREHPSIPILETAPAEELLVR